MIWTEISLTVSRGDGEIANAVLLRYCPGGLVERRGSGRTRVFAAYLPAMRRTRATLARLRAALRHGGVAARVRTARVRDEAWQDAWKVHAKPVRLAMLAVLPSWWNVEEPGHQIVVRIDPGQAFGSGEHPSTRLCLDAVARYVGVGASVIDVGTGSGVLAIAAARLGARRVLAIDNDPVAVRVARSNVKANMVAGRVRVEERDGLRGVRLQSDLILANLTADTLPPVLTRAFSRLAPGGRCVVAGFTAGRAREVEGAARAAGLEVAEITRRHGWCALHLRRRRGAARARLHG